MKKTFIFIFILTSINLFGYFESDFLGTFKNISKPYFYGYGIFGGDKELFEDFYIYFQEFTTGKINPLTFKKPYASLYFYMKFIEHIWGAEFFYYNRIKKLNSSTDKTNKKLQTVIENFNIYENNKIYNKLYAGVEISPYLLYTVYSEEDNNIFTPDKNITNTYAGIETKFGILYNVLSFLSLKAGIGPDISYHVQTTNIEYSLVSKVDVIIKSQIYLFYFPVWYQIDGYYKKNFFEHNFGISFDIIPTKYINFKFDLSETFAFVEIKVSPFSFVKFLMSLNYDIEDNLFGLFMGITLYYNGLGFPSFR